MQTGESFTVVMETPVDYLAFIVTLISPIGQRIGAGGWGRDVSVSTGVLARGTYEIQINNGGESAIGPYVVNISCITNNGEVKAGDHPQPNTKIYTFAYAYHASSHTH